MKQQKTILAAAVMAALLAPVYGEGVLAADTQSAWKEYTSTKTVDLTKDNVGEYTNPIKTTGNDTEVTFDGGDKTVDWTVKWTEDNQKILNGNETDPAKYPQGDNILVEAGSKLTIQNLNSLNFEATQTSKTSVDGALKAVNGANVTIKDIGTINFGTADNVLNADQGFHAYGAAIDVMADNLYGNVRGAGFLMAQSTNTNNKGTLKVDIANDVNLTSNYRALMTAGVYQEPDQGVENTLTAGGKITLRVTGEKASKPATDAVVGVTDEYYNGSYHYGTGDANLKISGAKGVSIISDKGAGLSVGRHSESGTRTLKVESAEGDVSIETAGIGISAGVGAKKKSDGTDNGTTDNLNATADISVTGKNVSVISKTNSAVDLDKNSTLNVASTQENGKIVLAGGNGVAADVSGENTTFTIGNGTAGTVELSGQIKAADKANVTIKGNTTTIADASVLKGAPLVDVKNGGSFNVADGAKLQVRGAYTGKSLYSTDGNTNSKVSFWDIANTSFANPLQYLGKNGVVEAGITEANKKNLVGYLALPVALSATTDNNRGVMSLIENGADAYNAAVGIGQAGGIQHSTYAVTGLVADALDTHEDTPEKDIWAKGFHSTEDIDSLGFAGGALNLDTQYNGAIVGADLYQKEGTAAGIAVSYADGSISGTNGAVYTKNDAEYLGVSLYGRKDLGAYRLAADLSYLGGSHDLTQYNNGTTVTAEPNTEAWSLGVKALRDYDFGSGTLTPYVGARYLRLTTDQYTSSLGLSYDKETQNLFLLPVGADYSLNLNRGSWNIKPYAGIGYIWTVGDRNADQTVSYGTAADTFAYDVTDAGSFLAKAGISAEHGDYSFGVGYAYQKGSTVDSDTWTVQAAYKF
ncbi:autotransporter outer membrane beta-barrel domain-containing protein [uncultured Megasphaera sp.]|uniref:autotransporter family protein n=1 Tax=uncultured Megasphaera sp. TaxID=165188 RepID=UPI00265AA52B|nr:autotransporter outer membrane beta-barrel domain-containing protein [uncultured Megasphaera sp.]